MPRVLRLARFRIEPVEDVLRRWPEPPEVLSAGELSYVAGFLRASDRQQRLAVRLLLRDCFRDMGISERVASVSHIGRGPRRGAPVLSEIDLQLSLGHCDGWAATCVGTAPVGVDVETNSQITACSDAASQILTMGEAALVRRHPDDLGVLWTAREALVKCGLGSLDNPQLDSSALLAPAAADGSVVRAVVNGAHVLSGRKGPVWWSVAAGVGCEWEWCHLGASVIGWGEVM